MCGEDRQKQRKDFQPAENLLQNHHGSAFAEASLSKRVGFVQAAVNHIAHKKGQYNRDRIHHQHEENGVQCTHQGSRIAFHKHRFKEFIE